MIIADSSFWIALANSRDQHHQRAKAVYDGLSEELITTWPVFAETCHMLSQRLGVPAQLRFVKAWIQGAFDLFDVPPDADERILELMKKYADLPMDLADASLVILAENLGHGRILSSDARDFKTYRWKTRKPFVNLLLE